MIYNKRSGRDTVDRSYTEPLDEVVGLLAEAKDLLDRDERPETESWKERVEKFVNDLN